MKRITFWTGAIMAGGLTVINGLDYAAPFWIMFLTLSILDTSLYYKESKQ